MKIEVLYFEDCPNYLPAVDRLRTVLRQEGLPAEVSQIEVRDASAAKAWKFFGSPTIRINGLDIDAESRAVTETGFACRRYPGGLPSEEMIRAALREAREQLNMSEQTGLPDRTTGVGRYSGARTTLASLAAIGSVLAASSCCLPLLPFMMAAGLAGGSAFLSAARPYLLAASILFVAYGFYQAWRVKKCQRRPSVIASALLWVSAFFVVISILFPQVMANAAAGLLAQ
jgi:hypothetical protein